MTRGYFYCAFLVLCALSLSTLAQNAQLERRAAAERALRDRIAEVEEAARVRPKRNIHADVMHMEQQGDTESAQAKKNNRRNGKKATISRSVKNGQRTIKSEARQAEIRKQTPAAAHEANIATIQEHRTASHPTTEEIKHQEARRMRKDNSHWEQDMQQAKQRLKDSSSRLSPAAVSSADASLKAIAAAVSTDVSSGEDVTASDAARTVKKSNSGTDLFAQVARAVSSTFRRGRRLSGADLATPAAGAVTAGAAPAGATAGATAGAATAGGTAEGRKLDIENESRSPPSDLDRDGAREEMKKRMFQRREERDRERGIDRDIDRERARHDRLTRKQQRDELDLERPGRVDRDVHLRDSRDLERDRRFEEHRQRKEQMLQEKETMRAARRADRPGGEQPGRAEPIDPATDRGDIGAHHMAHANTRVEILMDRLDRYADRFSADEKEAVKAAVKEYEDMEKQVAAARSRTVDDFKAARNIVDRDERKAFMDELKLNRDARRDEERELRNSARDKYKAAKRMIDDRVMRELSTMRVH